MLHDLLVEIGTEELPPKALKKLSDAFTAGIVAGLAEAGLVAAEVHAYAAPRRLAVWLKSVPKQQADQIIERKGPRWQQRLTKKATPAKQRKGLRVRAA
ncbi:glycine--tRNA ligase subunit beta [Thiothrix subterranea]|uniref:glycine--tRNA ligase subunit beta n=1 Tax=Thiothrix subterranea TaxID=2735563 RepID=UPI00280B86B1|nr:glycine--tRNA ligase subunit beta [Thiothrix subterranea]